MKILVALDDSKCSQQAFEYICSQIQPAQHELLLLNVCPPEPLGLFQSINTEMKSKAHKHTIEIGKKLLTSYKSECDKKNIKASYLVASGEPGPEICTTVQERRIDLLVMGRSGEHGALQRFMLGSVSEYCSRHASCSVLVVKFDQKRFEQQIVHGRFFLQKTHLCEALSGKPVVSIISDQLVKDALERLLHHKITSLPVYESKKKSYTGLLEVSSLISFALETISEDSLDAAVQEKFDQTLIEELLPDIRRRSTFLILNCEVSLLKAIELMQQKQLERIGVEVDEGELIGVLSQSQLLKFVLTRLDRFHFGSKTVQELNLGFREVFTLSKQLKLKEAFKILLEKKFSGAGVVDENGNLIGNFSLSDFKFAAHFNLRGFMNLDIGTLLQIKPLSVTKDRNWIVTPICVKPAATIHEVMEKFRITLVHRIFVVDDVGKLIGVISLQDILDLIVTDV